MSKISFPKKPRKDGAGLFTLDGNDVFIGRDWALQNEINDTLAKTQARSCFKACRTCGACANSKRDNFTPRVVTDVKGNAQFVGPRMSYDSNAHKWVDCRSCEKFRFHDCHNGWMRDSRQEAEPFTEDAQKLFAQGGKPLI